MKTVSAEPPEPRCPPPGARGVPSKPRALARALADWPDLAARSSIAVIGPSAPACQLALIERGFTCVTAASRRGATLLRERYGCLCVVESDTDARFDAESLAALRRRLAPGGVLVLEIPLDADRTDIAERLHAARFSTLQYRVVGVQHADGMSHAAVFVVAHASPDTVSTGIRLAA
jgi:hypothetical protein